MPATRYLDLATVAGTNVRFDTISGNFAATIAGQERQTASFAEMRALLGEEVADPVACLVYNPMQPQIPPRAGEARGYSGGSWSVHLPSEADPQETIVQLFPAAMVYPASASTTLTALHNQALALQTQVGAVLGSVAPLEPV